MKRARNRIGEAISVSLALLLLALAVTIHLVAVSAEPAQSDEDRKALILAEEPAKEQTTLPEAGHLVSLTEMQEEDQEADRKDADAAEILISDEVLDEEISEQDISEQEIAKQEYSEQDISEQEFSETEQVNLYEPEVMPPETSVGDPSDSYESDTIDPDVPDSDLQEPDLQMPNSQEPDAPDLNSPDPDNDNPDSHSSDISDEEEASHPEETGEESEDTQELSDPYDMGEDFDYSSFSNLNFSSRRLILGTYDESIFADPSVILSDYNGIYLLQFEDEETTLRAYAYYYYKADLLEVDSGIMIAEGESADVVNTYDVMTEDENPLSQLQAAIETSGFAAYDIALIDTGASGAEESVSMLGDNPWDENGHGTSMLGYIREHNPGARVISIKALGADGKGNISDVYAAIQYAIAKQVRILNLSVSALASADSELIRQAIGEAVAAGMVVVGAAGNNGRNAAYFVPGGIDAATIIGAADERGARIPSSNYGETVDYQVVASSTSEAAARFSGWLSAHSMEALREVLNRGLIYESGFDPDTQNMDQDMDPSERMDALRRMLSEGGTRDEIVRLMEGLDPALAQNMYLDLSLEEGVQLWNIFGIYDADLPVEEQMERLRQIEDLFGIHSFTTASAENGNVTTVEDPHNAGNIYIGGRYGDYQLYDNATGEYYWQASSTYGVQTAEGTFTSVCAQATHVSPYWRSTSVEQIANNAMTMVYLVAPCGPLWGKYDFSTRLGSLMADGFDSYLGYTDKSQILAHCMISGLYSGDWGPWYDSRIALLQEAVRDIEALFQSDTQCQSYLAGARSYAAHYDYNDERQELQDMFWVETSMGTITLTKSSNADLRTYPLTGALYSLYRENGSWTGYLFLTDANGTGYVSGQDFKSTEVPSGGLYTAWEDGYYVSSGSSRLDLPAGSYLLREIKAPDCAHYLCNDGDAAFTLASGERLDLTSAVTRLLQESERSGAVSFSKNVVENTGILYLYKETEPENVGGDFEFTLTADQAGITYTKWEKNAQGGWKKISGSENISLKSGDKFTLKDQQRASIVLPAGTAYTVTETDYSGTGWTTQIYQGSSYAKGRSVSGSIASANQNQTVYRFTVTGLPEGSFDWYIEDTKQAKSISNNAVIRLKSGETAHITGLPAGTKVTITEDALSNTSEGNWKGGGSVSGTVAADTDTFLGSITNTFTPAQQSHWFRNIQPEQNGSVSFSKKAVDERGILSIYKETDPKSSGGDFTFTLKSDQSGVTYTKWEKSASGSWNKVAGFSDVAIESGGTFTLKDQQRVTFTMPAGTAYQVTEKDYSDSSWITNVGTGASYEKGNQAAGTIASANAGAIPYTFTVTGLPDGNYDWYIGNEKQGTIRNQGTITLTNGQTARIDKIPKGSRITVTEVSPVVVSGGSWSGGGSVSAVVTAGKDTFLGMINNVFTPEESEYYFQNIHILGSIQIEKEWDTTGLSAQNLEILKKSGAYSVEGTKYQVYTDSACTKPLKSALLTIHAGDDTGMFGMSDVLSEIPMGTYYLKETAAGKGLDLDPKVYSVSIKEDNYKITQKPASRSKDPVKLGSVSLCKQPSVPEAVKGNLLYTLQGAKYGVYLDPDCKELYTEAVTNVQGSFKVQDLPYGTYYIREITPSKGYGLAECAESPHKIELSAKEADVSIVCEEPLQGILPELLLQKIDDASERPEAQGGAFLQGAEYTVRYYPAADESKDPERTWVLVTDADGKIRFSTEYLKTGSSSLYQTASGSVFIPLGSFTVQETKAPEGYRKEDTVYRYQVLSATDISAGQDPQLCPVDTTPSFRREKGILSQEAVIRGGVMIQKIAKSTGSYAPGDTSLQGAEYTIYNQSARDVLVDGMFYAKGEAVKTITTDLTGVASTGARDLPYGDYTIKETKASTGFLLDTDWSRAFRICEEGVIVDLSENPQQEPEIQGSVIIRKIDADHQASIEQGDASLEGAVFTIYNLSAAPVVVGGKTCEVNEEVLTITTDHSGRAFASERSLPYGTYRIQETAAPEGYGINPDWNRIFTIRSDGQIADFTMSEEDMVTERILRGGICMQKINAELKAAETEGLASLEGVTIGIVNASDAPVYVEGVWYSSVPDLGQKEIQTHNFASLTDTGYTRESLLQAIASAEEAGQDVVVKTLTTDRQGTSSTGPDTLPYGTYYLYEVSANDSLLVDEDWILRVEIREPDVIIDASQLPVTDSVVRGDLSFSKVNIDGTFRPNVPFLFVAYDEAGEAVEAHVAVTDATGMINTAARDNTNHTNALDTCLVYEEDTGEYYLNADGEALLASGEASTYGIWFGQGRDPGDGEKTAAQADPVKNSGSFYYGNYRIFEISCESNREKSEDLLHSPVISIRGKHTVLDASGRILREEGDLLLTYHPFVDLEIVLASDALDDRTESKVTFVSDQNVLSDRIQYAHLKTTSTYRWVIDFVETDRPSHVVSEIVVDGYQPAPGRSNLETAEGAFTVHTDGTLTDADCASEPVIITTGNVDTIGMEGKSIAAVVYLYEYTSGYDFETEQLRSVQNYLTSHNADLSEEREKIYIPSMATRAYDGETGDHAGAAAEKSVIAGADTEKSVIYDDVILNNLGSREHYLLEETILDRDTNEIYPGAKSVSRLFYSGRSEGVVPSYQLTMPALEVEPGTLDGRTLVCREELWRVDEQGEKLDEIPVICQEDPLDEEESIHYVEIRTVAENVATNSRLGTATEKIQIKDTVQLKNLIPGEEYTIHGALVYREDCIDNRKQKHAAGDLVSLAPGSDPEKTILAETPDMKVEINFLLDASSLEGISIVATEEVYHKDVLLQKHADLEDTEQTIVFPEIHTVLYETRDEADIDAANEGWGTTFADASGAAFSETSGDAYADTEVALIDLVYYRNLVPGMKYVVKGILMDSETGKPVQDDQGVPLTSSIAFVPETAEGYVKVPFAFDGEDFAGHSLVAFETLEWNDIVLAEHHDLEDEAQTVRFPAIATDLLDRSDSEQDMQAVAAALLKERIEAQSVSENVLEEKNNQAQSAVIDTRTEENNLSVTEVLASNRIELTDMVVYENLLPGKTYTVKGILMDPETGAPVLDDDGEQISAASEFVPDTPTGYAEVLFTFSGLLLAGRSAVAFEKLYRNEKLVAVHANLRDPKQTVHFPRIKTTLRDTADDGKDAFAGEEISLKDTVIYEHLTVGEEYTVQGGLMDAETGEVLLDDNGKEITATTQFSAAQENGNVEVKFVFPGTTLAGKKVVAFERLYRKNKQIAVHADLTDEEQIVWIPRIRTTLTDRKNGGHDAYAGHDTSGRYDSFGRYDAYAGYNVYGGHEREAFADQDTYTGYDTNGGHAAGNDVDYEIPLNSDPDSETRQSDVGYEIPLYSNPDSQTWQSAEGDIMDAAIVNRRSDVPIDLNDREICLVDTILYDNLIPGETYSFQGKLYDQETREPALDDDGREITAISIENPLSSSGSIEVVFHFRGTKLAGHRLVAYEEVKRDHKTVAAHKDPEDKEQIVDIPKIGTVLHNAKDKSKEITASSRILLKDTVSYQKLLVGQTYLLRGILMDSQTGKAALDDGGNEIRAESYFTPEHPEGTIEILFDFSGTSLTGHSLVAIEELYTADKLVASHADLTDDDQTVRILPGPKEEKITPVLTGDDSNLQAFVIAAALSVVVIVSSIAAGLYQYKEKKRR